MNTEIKKIWKALPDLDKVDIQTAALCHAIVTMLIDKGIGSQDEIAEEMQKNIPKVMAVRKEIAELLSDPHNISDESLKNKTIH